MKFPGFGTSTLEITKSFLAGAIESVDAAALEAALRTL